MPVLTLPQLPEPWPALFHPFASPLYCGLPLPENRDLKNLQGKWTDKVELGGQPMADSVLKALSLTLDRGGYEAFVGNIPDRGHLLARFDHHAQGDDGHRHQRPEPG